jgi:hypothetical protein
MRSFNGFEIVRYSGLFYIERAARCSRSINGRISARCDDSGSSGYIRTLKLWRLVSSAAAIALTLVAAEAARAGTAPVNLPDNSHPESVTSTSDGTLYVGSYNHGGVTKIAPTGKPEQLIKPGAAGSRSTLGVLADERSSTLYVCSNDVSRLGIAGPSDTKGAWLKTFDLETGSPKESFALSDPNSYCNDIAIDKDGTAFVSDSSAPTIYRLRPGGATLETFLTDQKLAPAKYGDGLDGIAIGADGNLYVTTFLPAKLFRVSMNGGNAGTVTELKPSRPLDRADALRAHGGGTGKLDKVLVKGDQAEIETIKEGLAEPVSVTEIGGLGWVAEGKLSYILGDNRGKDPGPFKLTPIALPK